MTALSDRRDEIVAQPVYRRIVGERFTVIDAYTLICSNPEVPTRILEPGSYPVGNEAIFGCVGMQWEHLSKCVSWYYHATHEKENCSGVCIHLENGRMRDIQV